MAKVKKLINDYRNIVDEMLEGYVEAYSDSVELLPKHNVLVRKDKKENGVGLVIGNGAGHEPAVIGWVGEGMLDANAVGGIFAAPGPDTLYEAVVSADNGKGTVLLVSNHAGDVINAEIAMEMLEDDGINARKVILYDDIASAPRDEIYERRGAIGTIFNYKITGAYAEKETDIEKVVKMAERVRDNTVSVGTAILPGTSPITGEKMFELPDDEVEIGIGVHGEAAVGRAKLISADDVTEKMCKRLIDDLGVKSGDKIIPIVNGYGSTTMMELFIVYRKVGEILNKIGAIPCKPLVGEFITTQEMAGVSIAFCRSDDEMLDLWSQPTKAPYFVQS